MNNFVIKPGTLFITNQKCIFTRLHKSKKRFITGSAVTFKTFPKETPLLFIKYIKKIIEEFLCF